MKKFISLFIATIFIISFSNDCLAIVVVHTAPHIKPTNQEKERKHAEATRKAFVICENSLKEFKNDLNI